MTRVKKLASLIFVTVLIVTLIIGVAPLVLADHNGNKGSFDILVFEDGDWQLQGELSFSDYETLELPLDNDAGQVSIKLVQHGHDAAYVDYVALQKDLVTYLPSGAINVNSNTNVLNKIISPEYDVCDAWDGTLETVWDNVPADTTLIMRAMEEDLGIGHGGPLYYPNIQRGETLGYALANDGGITVDGVLEESEEPDFSVFWEPDSPHPDGYTYAWLHCDGDYLYAAVEVTADNTPDEEDWGALYVMVDGELRKFRISCDDNQWGTNGFQYTSSVIYEHRIYEFQIPLSEINARIGDEIDYGFGCYGTVFIYYEVWVDDNWVGLNPGDPADGHTFGMDAFATIQNGSLAVYEDGTVHVAAGIYHETVDIYKSLTLLGEGRDVVTVDAQGAMDNVFSVNADYVTISGFNITGADRCSYAGVYVDRTNHCEISHNTITGNGDGIYLSASHDNTITYNDIYGNCDGVYLYYATSNQIEDNDVHDNGHGIYLSASNDTEILRNNILDNRELDSGIHLESGCSGNVIHCNNIVGNDPYGVSYGGGMTVVEPPSLGLYNQDGDEPVDATGNWWGCIEGPGAAGCDLVSGDVIYDPWLLDEFQYCRECREAPTPPGVPAANHWGIVAMIALFAWLLLWTVRRRLSASQMNGQLEKL
jgi:parallel beta-helix repeat protein